MQGPVQQKTPEPKEKDSELVEASKYQKFPGEFRRHPRQGLNDREQKLPVYFAKRYPRQADRRLFA